MLTTGGSESILVALKAYKERGASAGITDPEAIVPVSSHPAFAKERNKRKQGGKGCLFTLSSSQACNYFGIRLVVARTDADGRVDVQHVKSLINRLVVV